MQALITLVKTSTNESKDDNIPIIPDNTFLEYQQENVDIFSAVQCEPRPRQIKTHFPYDFLPLGVRGENPPKVTLERFKLGSLRCSVVATTFTGKQNVKIAFC